MRFTFFWGGPFSQWHKSPFRINRVHYNTAEQYMMHQKALLFGDKESALKILSTGDPKKQKALGREVKNFDKNVWNSRAKSIVYTGNHAKFTQNATLMQELIKTAPTTLVEASPYDTIWGIGMKEGDPGIEDPANWRGTNWLGEVLTKLRIDLHGE